jgi:hypothetical protein
VKRLPILAKMLLLLVCFSVMLSANNMCSIINGRLIIPYVADGPLMDGDLDQEWADSFVNIGMQVYTTNNDPILPAGGAADLSAFFMAAWNEEGFYFYGQAFDDTVIVAPEEDEHVSDSWELFFDGDNSKGAAYDGVNDVQFRWIYDYDYETKYGIVDEEVYWTEIASPAGYAIELSLPASSLEDSFGVVLAENAWIGFEVQVNDAEVEGTRQNQVKWWNEDDRAWTAPSYFGTAVLSDAAGSRILQIPKVTDPPLMDGDLDAEWTDSLVPKIAMPVATSNNVPNFADGGYEDLSASYRVAWNDDGLYFYGECIDDTVIVAPVEDEHVSDSWELFFDGDNSKGAAYDGVNDFQFRWIYDYDYETKYGVLDEEVYWTKTPAGYAIELLLPATSLLDSFGVDLADDAVIGWEVQINDAEVEGTRQNQIKWWNEDDRAWTAPLYFGTAVLSTGLNEDKVPETVASNIALSVPAIITSNSVVVSVSVPAGVAAKVSLCNIAGQVVAAANGNTLDVSGLANGVYLCNLKAGNESVTKKVMLLK